MKTLPDTTPTRKQRFDAAVKLSGMTQGEWADLHGVTPEHVRLVVKGERTASAGLNAAIDATITKYLGAVAA